MRDSSLKLRDPTLSASMKFEWPDSTAQRSKTTLATSAFVLLFLASAFGDTATWKTVPTNGDWNTAANWNPAIVPNSGADTAVFGLTQMPAVSISADVEVAAVIFQLAASAYTITAGPELAISGLGITNASGLTQRFNAVPDGQIVFSHTASAGSGTLFTISGSDSNGLTRPAVIDFLESASAGNGSFIVNGGPLLDHGGLVQFYGTSTAASAMFSNNADLFNGGRGSTAFYDHASAGNGTFTNDGGRTLFFNSATAGNAIITSNGTTSGGSGVTEFHDMSSGENATLIANNGANSSGEILFFDNSTGGNARVELYGNGALKMVLHQSPGISVGSIEGSGLIYLGNDELTVGSNNVSTEFSGVIQDGGNAPNETGGSLTKVGTGTLTLSGANTYTGNTTVDAGSLLVNGSITSPVTVNGGILGGNGTTGAVMVNSGGVLSPGASPGILHVTGNLTLALGSTYLVQLNGITLGSQFDQVSVVGTVTLNGATLSLSLAFIPLTGTIFTIIDNDSNDAINGTFSGLPEGSSLSINGQLATITYTGGTGNDVAITVVPEPATWAFLLLGSLIAATRFGVVARKRRLGNRRP